MKAAMEVKNIEKISNGYMIDTDGVKIKFIFMTDDILRIRASFDDNFKEASYAMVTTAWEDELDGLLKDERTRIEALDIDYKETEKKYTFSTATMDVDIYKSPYGIKIKNKDGEILHEDLRGRTYQEDHLGRRYHYSKLDFDRDKYYGFGERTGEINKIRRKMRNNPKDSIGHDPEKTDCLYKHIPFYIKLNSENKKSLGFFYNNTFESSFDMGDEISGYWDRYSYFCTDGGDIDLYIINGPEISKIVERYTDLTGKSYFPPLYSLGYLGSTMYYVELPENCDDEIVDFVDKNFKEDIPISGFQLSSGYTVGDDGQRYVFHWNNKRFTDPTNFFSEMNSRGVPVSPNIKPALLTTHPNYDTFSKAGSFIKSSKDNTDYVDRWWGGYGSFVDFTSEEGRNIWKKMVKEQLIAHGVPSLWNDNCEYDGIDDKLSTCSYEGMGGTVAELKPVMPLMMAFTGKEALKEALPNTRPFSVNRSGYAGIQRYASTWAGDNFTSWKTLKYNTATILGMGLSGVAVNGCDIGGFWGANPEAELLVRWVQAGIFQPRFSIHSCNTNNTVTEPWMYKDHTDFIRKAIRLRYDLLPYIYSLTKEASEKGTPIMRPMFYEFQNDERCYEEGVDFMFGPSILVANVVEKGAKTRKIYLPEGTKWYDFWTREEYKGGQEIEIEVDIESIPMFIRGDAIIPMTKGLFNLVEDKTKEINYIIGAEKDSEFTLYEDEGNTNDYLNGEYLKTDIRVEAGEVVNIHVTKEGNYATNVENNIFEVFNKEKGLYWVKIDGREIKQFIHRDKWEEASEGWYYSNSKGAGMIKTGKTSNNMKIEASYGKFDLIGMEVEEE